MRAPEPARGHAGGSHGGARPTAARAPATAIDWPQVATLAAVLAVGWILWPTWVVYPLKILVVFFHELSHGLAAVATGGAIVDIELVAREGGACRTQGGSRWLILTAGYLGSLAWGGAILLAAGRSRADKAVTTVLGLVLLAAALLWVRPFLSFGFGFAFAAAVGLVAAGLYLPAGVNDFLLKVVGLASVFYAVLDIRDDVLARPHLLDSDAAQLARLTGVPTLFWGVLWLALAVAAGSWFAVTACRRPVAQAGSSGQRPDRASFSPSSRRTPGKRP